jgi:hypothetical protein
MGSAAFSCKKNYLIPPKNVVSIMHNRRVFPSDSYGRKMETALFNGHTTTPYNLKVIILNPGVKTVCAFPHALSIGKGIFKKLATKEADQRAILFLPSKRFQRHTHLRNGEPRLLYEAMRDGFDTGNAIPFLDGFRMVGPAKVERSTTIQLMTAASHFGDHSVPRTFQHRPEKEPPLCCHDRITY